MRRRVTVVALSVCLSVCLSVTTLAAASFISTIKLRYAGLQLSILSIFNSWIFKMLRSKLWRHLLTVTVSDGIAATPVSFFPTEEGSDVVKRLTLLKMLARVRQRATFP